MIKNMVLESLN
jgi:hypothetical protein